VGQPGAQSKVRSIVFAYLEWKSQSTTIKVSSESAWIYLGIVLIRHYLDRLLKDGATNLESFE